MATQFPTELQNNRCNRHIGLNYFWIRNILLLTNLLESSLLYVWHWCHFSQMLIGFSGWCWNRLGGASVTGWTASHIPEITRRGQIRRTVHCWRGLYFFLTYSWNYVKHYLTHHVNEVWQQYHAMIYSKVKYIILKITINCVTEILEVHIVLFQYEQVLVVIPKHLQNPDEGKDYNVTTMTGMEQYSAARSCCDFDGSVATMDWCLVLFIDATTQRPLWSQSPDPRKTWGKGEYIAIILKSLCRTDYETHCHWIEITKNCQVTRALHIAWNKKPFPEVH